MLGVARRRYADRDEREREHVSHRPFDRRLRRLLFFQHRVARHRIPMPGSGASGVFRRAGRELLREPSTVERARDQYLLIPSPRDRVVLLRSFAVTVTVLIVHCELDEVDRRLLLENHVECIGLSEKSEADLPDEPRLLHFVELFERLPDLLGLRLVAQVTLFDVPDRDMSKRSAPVSFKYFLILPASPISMEAESLNDPLG